MLMLAQIVQLQVVLVPLWFRANGQRGMTKPVSAESHKGMQIPGKATGLEPWLFELSLVGRTL